jgi:hypothetical protein
VQQLFEVLGFVKIPKVELSEPAITLRGKPGDRLEYVLMVVTQEKRPALGFGASDQPWLTVGKTVFRGQTASIPLTVQEVPHQPHSTLQATVKVTANGSQRFEVPVRLHVGDGAVSRPSAPSVTPAEPEERSVVALSPDMLVPAPPAPVFAPAPAPAPVAAPPPAPLRARS